MNAERASRWLTLLANVGVLLGIALLVVELDQNRDVMRAQMRHQLAAEGVAFLEATSHDGELADIIVRANKGEELNEVDMLRYEFRQRAYFRRAENSYYQYRQGFFDEDQYLGMVAAWKGYVNRFRSVAEVYCLARPTHSREFAELMDELVEIIECE